MANKNILTLIGHTDIYLLDQILKDRFQKHEAILDVGCGEGRNLVWFYQNGYNISAIDIDEQKVYKARVNFPRIKDQIHVLSIDEMNQLAEQYDHIICNAVLHFAESTQAFHKMFSRLWKSLKSNGSLFIRMTSDIGIEKEIVPIGKGKYTLPDGTTRFLLTRPLVKEMEDKYRFEYIEPLKTVNVNDLRCMTTLVLRKS